MSAHTLSSSGRALTPPLWRRGREATRASWRGRRGERSGARRIESGRSASEKGACAVVRSGVALLLDGCGGVMLAVLADLLSSGGGCVVLPQGPLPRGAAIPHPLHPLTAPDFDASGLSKHMTDNGYNSTNRVISIYMHRSHRSTSTSAVPSHSSGVCLAPARC